MPSSGNKVAENSPDLWAKALPWPDSSSHKHARGGLGCVTGGLSSTGAARLSARAGLRIGAGLATLFSPPAAVIVNASHVTAVMVRSFSTSQDLRALANDMACVVIGPAAGVTDATRENVLALLASDAHIVLDADGLTVFKDDPDALFSRLRPQDVLTPHIGEFRRLFPDLETSDDSRLGSVQQAANRAGAIVLLKGAETIIATPDGQTVINRHASPFLATAGSGDTLAGMIAGLIAQGMASFEATCAACWMHGEAGRRLGPGLISEDLPEILPAILAGFHADRT